MSSLESPTSKCTYSLSGFSHEVDANQWYHPNGLPLPLTAVDYEEERDLDEAGDAACEVFYRQPATVHQLGRSGVQAEVNQQPVHYAA